MTITLTFATHAAADLAYDRYCHAADLYNDSNVMNSRPEILYIKRYNRTVTMVFGS